LNAPSPGQGELKTSDQRDTSDVLGGPIPIAALLEGVGYRYQPLGTRFPPRATTPPGIPLAAAVVCAQPAPSQPRLTDIPAPTAYRPTPAANGLSLSSTTSFRTLLTAKWHCASYAILVAFRLAAGRRSPDRRLSRPTSALTRAASGPRLVRPPAIRPGEAKPLQRLYDLRIDSSTLVVMRRRARRHRPEYFRQRLLVSHRVIDNLSPESP
jgi:hypothetical protein